MDFVFDPSLVLYLPLYGLHGASFASKDAYGHLCSVAGATWRPEGRYFDGVDDYVTVPHNNNTALAGSCTAEAWVNFTPKTSRHQIAIKRITTAKQAYDLAVRASTEGDDSNKAYFNAYDGTHAPIISGSTIVADSSWHHVAGVRDAGKYLYLYVDGQSNAIPVADTITGDPSNTDDVTIGARLTAGQVFYSLGYIGEVRIYRRALSPLEIQRNYLATKWRYQ